MIKYLKAFSILGLLGCLIIPGDLQARCTESKVREYRAAYTFETKNLVIVPVTTLDEYEKLMFVSQDDQYSYMFKDLYKEYGFPDQKEGWQDQLQTIFDNDKFCTPTTLPILFAAYKKEGNELIGFYAYLPRKYDYFEHTRLEQRSLLTKEARSGGLGTEFRRAMISYFQKKILHHDFEVFSQSPKNISFRKDTIEALTSGVAVYNFASLISNIRACLPVSIVDQDMIFMIPNSTSMTADEFREALCKKVIIHDDIFGRDITSANLNPLVCDATRPESIPFDKSKDAKSAHNIAFSINKLIDEFAKQPENCK